MKLKLIKMYRLFKGNLEKTENLKDHKSKVAQPLNLEKFHSLSPFRKGAMGSLVRGRSGVGLKLVLILFLADGKLEKNSFCSNSLNPIPTRRAIIKMIDNTKY